MKLNPCRVVVRSILPRKQKYTIGSAVNYFQKNVVAESRTP